MAKAKGIPVFEYELPEIKDDDNYLNWCKFTSCLIRLFK
jgi:hypothetical protein